ncbi:tail fiber assembly protein [Enterobacter asburiae]|uniref:tail fiber assembly protein n=1 Tax=Enterobacter asburiae TaxID=61645 RepID=UPI0007C80D33|nr:tail fiber assembly protein [Enterobacter asburiae]
MYVFSAKNNAFYPLSLQENYEENNSWPADGKEVSEEEFSKYSGIPPQGKMRGSTANGMPAWIDIPPPTHDEFVSSAETEKQNRIDHANAYMNSKQWPGKAAIGRLKGDELDQYNLWLDYLDALEVVDTSTAPDITWPMPPAA